MKFSSAEKKIRRAYVQQRETAKQRGIGWEFTLETWLEWWGADIGNRGRKAWNLQMQRFHDKGPYSPDNVRKGHPKRNAQTMGAGRRHRTAVAVAADIYAAQNAMESRIDDPETEESEDERELRGMFGLRGTKWHYVQENSPKKT